VRKNAVAPSESLLIDEVGDELKKRCLGPNVSTTAVSSSPNPPQPSGEDKANGLPKTSVEKRASIALVFGALAFGKMTSSSGRRRMGKKFGSVEAMNSAVR
jgi:hypothetical protein